ncbi:NAD dependent epimerase/dehydratase family domain-containing protein [Phthorimaea operculella]|nr:NAD dependent epimerase/dehydratase family domain-containing protein [Phthorimaea operculella]
MHWFRCLTRDYEVTVAGVRRFYTDMSIPFKAKIADGLVESNARNPAATTNPNNQATIKTTHHKMPKFRSILVTGGAGYIGSHCVVDLLEAGHQVIAIDNFANAVGDDEGSPALRRAEEITGKTITFYRADLLDKPQINDIFDKHDIDCVIHFAALKAVGESMQQPLLYYQNNLLGMLNLLEVMRSHNCYQMVFSSSCTVYGEPESLPITETHPTGNITNVYGRTKYFIEEMLKDLSAADKKWNIISLRYFNPVGAHPSGKIGEDPTKEFTNLMPFMAQVALGKKPVLTVFGSDYNTPDGTGEEPTKEFTNLMPFMAQVALGKKPVLTVFGSDYNTPDGTGN